MARRQVTNSRKGYDGDILAVCNPEEFWSPRFKHDVIRDIENKIHSYYVMVNGEQLEIFSELKNGSKRLITDREKLLNNKLEMLKDC